LGRPPFCVNSLDLILRLLVTYTNVIDCDAARSRIVLGSDSELSS